MVRFYVDNKKSNQAGILACYITSHATGVTIETFPTSYDKKHPQYAALSAKLPAFNTISPFGRAPVLAVDQQRGVYLFDVVAIMHYMTSKSSRWEDNASYVEEMWLEWLTSKLNHGELGMSTAELLKRLDSALQKTDGTSVIGGDITLADIAAWSVLHDAVASSAIDLTAHAKVDKWYQLLSQEKMFQAGIKAAKL